MRILPCRRANQSLEGVLVTFFDISRVIDAEAQQRTLIEELNHRVRNMLTVVNAIAHQTMRRSSSKESFVEAFTGRIRAMGTAYGVVSREQWGDVPLRDVIAGHLAHYQQDAPERVVIGGDNILCKPNAALALGLVIHELATNAVKYGALSTPSGHVAVNWSIEHHSQPVLTLIWREEGGPPANKPERKGFGTELVERELTHTLGATVNFQYHSAGLLLIINIPFHPSRIVKPPDKAAGP